MDVVRRPAQLLEVAWSAEVGLHLHERTAALGALAHLIDQPAPAGRSWRLEHDAEVAIDLARLDRGVEARALAEAVLAADPPPIAAARATEALGRALAWSGTGAATGAAERALTEAADRYEALGRPEWQGYALFWLANSVHLQQGSLAEADRGMVRALEVLPADSPRRAVVGAFHADVQLALGDWEGAAGTLSDAAASAVDPMSHAYVAWERARLASVRDDALMTERHLREAEREAAEWFEIHTGATFLADGAELLDRVGLRPEAGAYLRRAVQRAPDDEFVRQAVAVLAARSGPPAEAVEALQALARQPWLEKRISWRITLLRAWATLRAGGPQAADLARLAFEQASATGGGEVAVRGEPALARALLPVAEAAGSAEARRLMLGDGRKAVLRLFGPPRVAVGSSGYVALPGGQPGELVRMLAVERAGLAVEVVIERFAPDADASTGRHRLRQLLTRLRASVGPLVERQGDHLVLAPAWIDVDQFQLLADASRAASGWRAVELAHAAVAVWGGPPLPRDAYSPWADDTRRHLTMRYLSLLDLIASDADGRGCHEEALAALEAAVELEPDGVSRKALAAHLEALGRHAEAARWHALLPPAIR